MHLQSRSVLIPTLTTYSKELSDTNELVLSTQTSLLAYPVVRNMGYLEDRVASVCEEHSGRVSWDGEASQ